MKTPGTTMIEFGTPRRERGVALILTLLVMTILFVVVLQLKYSTAVDRAISRNLKDEVVLDLVARGALERAKAMLIMDLEDDVSATAESEGGSGEGEGGGGSGGAGGGAGLGMGGGGTGEESEKPLTIDSLDEEWAFGDNSPVLGSEAEVRVKLFIVDEDRKFNLLQIFTPDEADSEGRSYRERARERLVRLLDKFRDGREGDLDRGRAEEIVDNIIMWCEGRERDEEGYPTPPLKSSEPEEGEEQSAFQAPEEKPLLPLTLEELLMVPGIDESLYYGYRDGDEWVPGLEDLLTIYTVAELEDPLEPGEEGLFGGYDLNDDQKEDQGSGGSAGEGAGGGEGEEATAPQTDLGRINLNTAPEAVLLCLLPNDEFPETRVNDFIEWREEQLKEIAERIESGEEDLFGFSDSEGSLFDQGMGSGDEEVTYPITSLDDLDKLEFMQDTDRYRSGQDPKEEWKSFLTTKSHVFTITVVVWRPGSENMKVLSSVVWRFLDGDKATTIPIIPLHERGLVGLDMREIEKAIEEDDQWGS
ncbi:MAG: hypothetical protein AB1486_15870 [Planctomycetota bacterium]